MKKYLALLLTIVLGGCQGLVREGGSPVIDASSARVLLAPFHNATDDEHAARALTEITASTLMGAGLRTIQSDAIFKADSEAALLHDLDSFLSEARRPTVDARYLLTGTVHEYRYKTDLDGDPVVGLSMRLINVATEEILWQGSVSRTGLMFASLSSVSIKAVDQLIGQMPLRSR